MRNVTLLLVLMMLAGCSRTDPVPAPNKDSGHKDHVENKDGGENDPPEVKHQLALKKELAALKAVEPVPFEKLLEIIPAQFDDFDAEKGSGNIDLTGIKYSSAERKY